MARRLSKRSALLVGCVALGPLGAFGCGDGDGAGDQPPTVVITDRGYDPLALEVPVGSSVKFVNRAKAGTHSAKHDPRGVIKVSPEPGATKHDGSEVNRASRLGFATHALFPREAQTVVFPIARKYTYYCAFHDGMKGTIEVVPDDAG